jgi:predicted dehydrogenase
MTRVAVLGTGSIGTRHLQVLRTLADVQPLAIPVRVARASALQAEGFEVLPDLKAAAAAGVRLLVVATDTSRHAADAEQALQLGFDLLVEKPLTADAATAIPLQRLARESGRRVFVGCVLRFSTSLRAFRAALSDVGALHQVRIVCQSYLPDWRPDRPYRASYSARAAEGGVLRDLIHEIDYAGWLFGWPLRVSGCLRNLGRLGIEAEEQAELQWVVDGGPAVSISLDYLSRPTRRGIVACGANGTLEWDGVRQQTRRHLAGRAEECTPWAQERNGMFTDQARAFVQACSGGSAGELATLEDAVRALAVCDAARRSSVSHREEEVVAT